jgi:outer membrane receptor protein involved in Fe transport
MDHGGSEEFQPAALKAGSDFIVIQLSTDSTGARTGDSVTVSLCSGGALSWQVRSTRGRDGSSMGVTDVCGRYAPGDWSGGIRYRYLGPAPLIEDNSARSHSTTIVNAETGYRITPKIKLSLEVLNLFDSDQNDIAYFYDSQLPREANRIAEYHFHPVEPRQVRLTLRGTF